VCPWDTHFYERMNVYEYTHIYRATLFVQPDFGQKEIYFLSLENVKLIFINLIII